MRPGETVSSRGFVERVGGKGANTAVSISKAGQSVYFSGLVDHQSSWLKKTLNDFGVNVDQLKICDEDLKLPTGRAIIQVCHETGENAIVLVPGANHASSEFWPDLEPILLPSKYSHVLLQNEIPISQTVLTSKLAHSLGMITIFNPSPMPSLKEVTEVLDWSSIDWLIVNEEEAQMLKDRASSRLSLNHPLEFGELPQLATEIALLHDLVNLSLANSAIVITLGARGSLLGLRESASATWAGLHTPASSGRRPVVDTTGAGDCFTGFLVAELIKLGSDSKPNGSLLGKLQKSLEVANQAARLCVENHGTISSYPSLLEVESACHGAR